MNNFFTQLPVILASVSIAFLKSVKAFAVEIGTLLCDFLKWLWAVYYHIETAILETIATISLAIYAIRQVILLMLVGLLFAYIRMVVGFRDIHYFSFGCHRPFLSNGSRSSKRTEGRA